MTTVLYERVKAHVDPERLQLWNDSHRESPTLADVYDMSFSDLSGELVEECEAALDAEWTLRKFGLWGRLQDRREFGRPGVGIADDPLWAPIVDGREKALVVLAREVERDCGRIPS